jgi:hypothetical protein
MIGLTITCRTCSRSEFFEGGLRESFEKAAHSTTWRRDERGFVICAACAEAPPTAEAAE